MRAALGKIKVIKELIGCHDCPSFVMNFLHYTTVFSKFQDNFQKKFYRFKRKLVLDCDIICLFLYNTALSIILSIFRYLALHSVAAGCMRYITCTSLIDLAER